MRTSPCRVVQSWLRLNSWQGIIACVGSTTTDAMTQLTTFWATIVQVDCVLILALVVEGQAMARRSRARRTPLMPRLTYFFDEVFGGLPAVIAGAAIAYLAICIWHATDYLGAPTPHDSTWVNRAKTATTLAVVLLALRPIIEIWLGRLIDAIRGEVIPTPPV